MKLKSTCLLASAFMIASMSFTTGCVHVRSGGTQVRTKKDSVYIHIQDEDERATVEEIHAAKSLMFPEDRLNMLMNIAQRDNLGKHAQLELAKAGFGLMFPQDRVELLMAVIRRHDFDSKTKSFIIKNLNRLMFPDDRTRILEAINKHPGKNTEGTEIIISTNGLKIEQTTGKNADNDLEHANDDDVTTDHEHIEDSDVDSEVNDDIKISREEYELIKEQLAYLYKFNSSNERMKILNDILDHEELNYELQIAVLNAGYAMHSSNERMAIVKKIVARDDLHHRTKIYILQNLNKFNNSNERMAIHELINIK
ncbi:hypothetical protein JD969_08545 [Planctomycetota bacterium]|nr:hypothetical protein JD969_08545 [Planctomycetota bacterium]